MTTLKKFFFLFLGQFIIIGNVLAAPSSDPNAGVFAGAVSTDQLRNGNISFNDIPQMIQVATSFLLGFSATIAMIMIIVGALKLSLGSVNKQDKSKAKETITWGII